MATRPDTAAKAQLGQQVVRARFLAWLDLAGEPVRATTWPANLVPSGTGDPELDGHEFLAIDPQLADVGGVNYSETGADTVTFSLSGLILPDNELMNVVGNPANWKGKTARLWQGVADADWAPQGAIWSYFTGYIVNLRMDLQPDGAKILVQVETYLASLSPPSLRTYLDQREFDPEDDSAAAAIAIANGGFASGAVVPIAAGAGGARGIVDSPVNGRMVAQ